MTKTAKRTAEYIESLDAPVAKITCEVVGETLNGRKVWAQFEDSEEWGRCHFGQYILVEGCFFDYSGQIY